MTVAHEQSQIRGRRVNQHSFEDVLLTERYFLRNTLLQNSILLFTSSFPNTCCM